MLFFDKNELGDAQGKVIIIAVAANESVEIAGAFIHLRA